MNAIRDRVPARFFDEEDGEEEAPTPEHDDLLHRERSTWSKVTPNSTLGWIGYFAGGVLLIAFLSWARPLIPPWLTSLKTVLALLIPVGVLVGVVMGRQSGISFWRQFTTFKLYTGSTVTEFVGKIDDTAGGDPLIKVLTDIGWGGLSPSFERVDDRFTSDGPLLAKIDRKGKDGEWDPALGKLDHVYQADGPSSVFDEAVVVHCAGVTDTPTSPHFEWKTLPPNTVDVDAARELIKRDEVLREQVIPHYEEQLETSEERLESMRSKALEDGVIEIDDLPEFLEAISHVTRGQPRTRHSSSPVEDVDADVEDELEGRTDE